jgi:hypothetical protein
MLGITERNELYLIHPGLLSCGRREDICILALGRQVKAPRAWRPEDVGSPLTPTLLSNTIFEL